MPVDENLANIITSVIGRSPYARLLGMEVVEMEPDRVVMVLPFRQEVTTVGDIVHGGAIASLVDVAGAAAIWSNVPAGTRPRGVTLAFTLNFLAAADGQSLRAEASVLRRGGSIAFAEIFVQGEQGMVVAKGSLTYKVG